MKSSFNHLGAITCARYAFAPNYLHYCGPDTEGDFGAYVAESMADPRLTEYLTQFETLYPYLKSIALANNIADPFDTRVVDAYWVGNNLLNRVDPKHTHLALTDGQQLHHRLDTNSLKWVMTKIDQKAKLHHSFHVFNIFTRTGHRTVAHTVETMDQCRIGWGEVKAPISKQQLPMLKSQRLIYADGKLQFEPCEREVINPIEGLKLEMGDIVSFHWGYVCEKLSKVQAKNLEKLTLYHLTLANQTL